MSIEPRHRHATRLALVALALLGSACGRDAGHGALAPPVAAAVPAAAAAPSAAALTVTVSLSPALAGRAQPGDTVFVFARAATGPRMPLAIARRQVRDLPATVVLDDRSAMSPQMNLSSVPEVVVVARVSKSGNASPQAGDLEGTSGPVSTRAGAVAVRIDRVVSGP